MPISNTTEMVRTTSGSDTIQNNQSAFIFLPVSLFENFSTEGNTSQIGLFFTFYEQPVFFPLSDDGNGSDFSVGSAVIGASVSDREVRNLSEGVTISVRPFYEVQLHNSYNIMLVTTALCICTTTEFHTPTVCKLGLQCFK